jgi:hypothetical protein
VLDTLDIASSCIKNLEFLVSKNYEQVILYHHKSEGKFGDLSRKRCDISESSGILLNEIFCEGHDEFINKSSPIPKRL